MRRIKIKQLEKRIKVLEEGFKNLQEEVEKVDGKISRSRRSVITPTRVGSLF